MSNRVTGCPDESARPFDSLPKAMNNPTSHQEHHGLTSSQREIWFDQERHGEAPVYNIGGYVRISGRVDAALLARALELLIRRHDGLRIVLSREQDEEGVPRQEIGPAEPVVLPLHDLSASEDPEAAALAHVDRQLETPFVLRGAPLYRFELLKLGEACFDLVLVLHHLIVDGWAIGLMLESLGRIYGQLEAGQAPGLDAPSYLDFVEQDRLYRQSPKFEQHRAYWLDKFREVPEPLFSPRFKARFGDAVVPSRNHQFSLPRSHY